MKNEITQEIKESIEKRTGLDLGLKNRRREFVYCRSIYFKLCTENTELSITDIASTLNLNHATVLYSLKNTFPLIMDYEPKYSMMYKALKSPELIENVHDKYISLKEDYEALVESKKPNEDRDLMEIIKQIPEAQLDIAKLRINAMVQMLKTH
tara:strand:+ start:230 stop:688 length:459 start_codon:yes stop_codon:yes gene_type:complete